MSKPATVNEVTSRHSVLVIDDDQKLVNYVCEYLERYEFDTIRAYDGQHGAELIVSQQPTIVILDLMMPLTDGLGVCRKVRGHYTGFILMLTGIGDDIDQIKAIDAGVDDYIVKPVQLRVLLARLRMLLRRRPATSGDASQLPTLLPERTSLAETHELQFGKLRICQRNREAYLADIPAELIPSEFDLLWILANTPEEIFSREVLLKTLRGIDYDGLDRSIDTRIVGLRKKLGDNKARPFRIISVRARGYMFIPDAWDDI